MLVQLRVSPGLGRRKGCHLKTCTRVRSLLSWCCPEGVTGLSRKSIGQVGQGQDGQRWQMSLTCCCCCSAERRLCSPAPRIATALFGLLLHTIPQSKWEPKRNLGPVRGYRTNQHRRWEDTYSSIGVYWFFNCWAHLAAERVIGLKWATRKNNSQHTSKMSNFGYGSCHPYDFFSQLF